MEYAYATSLIMVWALASYLWLRRQPGPVTRVSANVRTELVNTATIAVIYASQGGSARKLAAQTATALQAIHPVHLLGMDEITPGYLSRYRTALFIVATHGDGDAPDHARAFARQYLASGALFDLSHLQAAVVALGDRSYTRYCAFGDALCHALQRDNAQLLTPVIHVDNMAPADVIRWHSFLRQQFNATAAESTITACRLVHREWLNPGSPHQKLFLLRLRAQGEHSLTWKPGAIAHIQLPGGDCRSYSAANISQRGELELIVRQVVRNNGQYGLGSGWLTDRADGGSNIPLELRDGVDIRGIAAHLPLILIGAGSGLAGLRSLLQQRVAQNAPSTWVIFGERDAVYDRPLFHELLDLEQRGAIAHLDCVHSRCPDTPCYVHQRLEQQADRIRDYLIQGGAIYVCGQAAGVGASVDQTLHSLFGAAVIDGLIAQKRYLRDIY